MLLVGQTGSGKSHLVHTLINKFELAYSPDQMKYALFDMKQVEFVHEEIDGERLFGREFLLFDVVIDPTFALERLDELAELARNRAKLNKPQPFIFIYIEECDIACEDQVRFDNAVITINENASKANIKLIYSTSRPGEDAVSKRLLHSFELVLNGPLVESDYDYLKVSRVSYLKPYDFAVTER